MPFPNQVNVQPAPAVAGDYASTNPRASLLAGAGGLVCGASGVTIGQFAWVTTQTVDDASAPATVNNFGTGLPAGFIHREQQGLMQIYLQEQGMVIPKGFPVTVMNAGDFWAVNSGSTQAVPGQYAFANFANGTLVFANGSQSAIGTGTTGAASVTGSIGPQTATFNGAITGNVLTVTALVSGTIQVGGTLSGGTGVFTGTSIVSQLSGTTGGIGTYALSVGEQTVASALLTESYGLLTAASVTGTLGVGDALSGTASGMVASIVTALGTGSGGAGTYIVNATQTITLNSIITAALNVQTKWVAQSSALAGELVKISSWVYG